MKRPFWVVEVKFNATDDWTPIEHAFKTRREAQSFGIQWWGADDHRADYRVVRVQWRDPGHAFRGPATP